eukprot:403366260
MDSKLSKTSMFSKEGFKHSKTVVNQSNQAIKYGPPGSDEDFEQSQLQSQCSFYVKQNIRETSPIKIEDDGEGKDDPTNNYLFRESILDKSQEDYSQDGQRNFQDFEEGVKVSNQLHLSQRLAGFFKEEITKNLTLDIEKDNERGPIRYGDLIFLSLNLDDSNSANQKQQYPEMLMYSKGYSDSSVNFKLPEKLNQDQIDKNKCQIPQKNQTFESSILNPIKKTYENMASKVASKVFQDKLAKSSSASRLIKQKTMSENNTVENQEEKKYEELSKCQDQVLQSIHDVDVSINANFNLYKEMIGKPVKYNDFIMLIHYHSGMILEVDRLKSKRKSSPDQRGRSQTEKQSTILSPDHELSRNLSNQHVVDESRGRVTISNLRHLITNKKKPTLETMRDPANNNQGGASGVKGNFTVQLSPYVSEWTQFKLVDFNPFQKRSSEGAVFNQDLFYLSHRQPANKIKFFASYSKNHHAIIFSNDQKMELVIQKAKKSLEQVDNNSHLRNFQDFGDRYVWLQQVSGEQYLNVKEKQVKAKQSSKQEEEDKQGDDDLIEGPINSILKTTMTYRSKSSKRYPDQSFHSNNKQRDISKDINNMKQTRRISILDQQVTLMRNSKSMSRSLAVATPKYQKLRSETYSKQLKVYLKNNQKHENELNETQIIDDYVRTQDQGFKSSKINYGEFGKYSKRGIWKLEFRQTMQKQDQKNSFLGQDNNPMENVKVCLKNVFFNNYLGVKSILHKSPGDNKTKAKLLMKPYADKFCEFDFELSDREIGEDSEEQNKTKKTIFLRLFQKVDGDTYVLCQNLKNDHKDRVYLVKYDEERKNRLKYKDLFEIVVPTKDEVWEIEFLSQFRRDLEQNLLTSTIDPVSIQDSLRILHHFLRNKLQGKINNSYEFGQVISERQNSFRSFQLMEILMSYFYELKILACKSDSVAYTCIKKIFKIFETLTYQNIMNQIAFLEQFDIIKDFISNSTKICLIMSNIVKNSQTLVRKMVKITDDIPENAVNIDINDGFFDMLQHKQENRGRNTIYHKRKPSDIRIDKIDESNLNSSFSSAESFDSTFERKGIYIGKIIDHFIQRLSDNAAKNKHQMNILQLNILQKFMTQNIDDGIFWNQWMIFKKMFPKNLKEINDEGVKVLQFNTFLPILFKDKTIYIENLDQPIHKQAYFIYVLAYQFNDVEQT